MNKTKIIIGSLLCLLMVTVLCALFYLDKQSQFESTPSRMVEKAEWFWEKGDKEKAITQLNIYLSTKKSDESAWLKLSNFYLDIGDDEASHDCLAKMQLYCVPIVEKENQYSLSPSSRIVKNKDSIKAFNLTIEPKYIATDDMSISISSGNITITEVENGEISGYSPELDLSDEGKRTTSWFDIAANESNICLAGDFTYAKWQFMDINGDIVKFSGGGSETYNSGETQSTRNKAVAIANIPSDAVKARVTFKCDNDDEVFLTYGKYPAIESTYYKKIVLPDIQIGEKLQYNSNEKTWMIIHNDSSKEIIDLDPFEIPADSYIYIDGNSCGLTTIDYLPDEMANEASTKTYGVRWRVGDKSPYCERLGDAQNFDFGYYLGEEWIGTNQNEVNDFDSVYPWSDIKICNIKQDGTIVYSDESTFSLDGSNGDVMIEIPKFYSSRYIEDGYEYIWISESPKDGYVLDPAFDLGNGECDAIYIGAYLSSIKDNGIVSTSGSNPLINISLDDVNAMVEQKGQYWSEIDYVTLSAIQRLYLVETACRNSQLVAMGVTNMSFGWDWSVGNSDKKVNYITLKDSDSSRKYAVGDAVTVFNVPNDEQSFYNTFTEYDNSDSWNRTVTSVSKQDGYITVGFSGDAIYTTTKTMIMHLPQLNGETDTMEYPTGQKSSSSLGDQSFRYRYIENLWGSVCVMLDGVSISDGSVLITYPNGNTTNISYIVTEQTKKPSESVIPSISSISEMGFDSQNPFIMLPTSVGNGASATLGYCDSWFYKKSSTKTVLTYGLTWDLRQYAGLFGYRADSESSANRVETGSRLIYRKESN